MDSYKTLLINNFPEINDIFSLEISEEDSKLFNDYVELSTSIQEVEQLYIIFLFNVNAFSPYKLQMDDRVIEISTGKEIDFYSLNALTINLISSGRCLVEMMDVILENDLPQNSFNKFRKEYSSIIYDQTFGYRFLNWLRNISQHGYIPVSRKYDGRFCFDLEQIRNLRHFNYNNKTISQEIDKIISDIRNIYQDNPDLCFSHIIDEYIRSVIEIYFRFLDFIRPDVESICDKAEKCIKLHPEYVCKDERCKGFIAYKIEDGNMHLFNSGEDFRSTYLRIRGRAKKKYKNYDRDFHLLE